MKLHKQLTSRISAAMLIFACASGASAQEFDFASMPYMISGEPAITSTNVSDGGATIYEIRFNTDLLVGDLIARSITADGEVAGDTFDPVLGLITSDGALWRASRTLRNVDQNDRTIFTAELEGSSNTLTGEVFRWQNLEPHTREKIDPLAHEDDINVLSHAQNNILDYVRGDSTHEGFGPTDLRNRNSEWIGSDFYHNRMGSVVRSSPAYVAGPREFYTDADYKAFRTANKNRTPMVYVGANDGMLHAFKAANGEEVFGFVPAGVHNKLADFAANATASQTYTVDGAPTVTDAKGAFPGCGGGSCWRTILVGGLNAGGRSVYALDVTNPIADASSEANAKNKLFLWEFAAQDTNGDGQIKNDRPSENANLGYTFSQPVIAQLNDTAGTWVAIFGNGYNAIEQQNKKSVTLFIVNLATGALIKSIEAKHDGDHKDGQEPNGLSSVTPYDKNLDGTVDLVYAGDLWGNLWKFDLSGTNPANYDVAYKRDITKDEALIQVTTAGASDKLQPITTAPLVTTNPDGGLIVYFGTGLALDVSHDTVIGDRGIFAIYDEKPVHAGDNDYPPYALYPDKSKDDFQLDIHTIAQTTEGTLRGIANTTPANSPDNLAAHPDNVGWFLKFPNQEQLLTNMTLINKRLSFTSTRTVIGQNNFNWLNGVDFLTGGAPATPYFDANVDGEIKDDGSDLITVPGPTGPVVPIAGALGIGIPSSPRLATVSSGNDIFLTTSLVEFFARFDSPFTDGGLPGGHFDEDEAHGPEYEIDGVPIDWDNVPFGESTFGSVKHTHEYDDKLDINGVNLLRLADEDLGEITEPSIPPHVETSGGMLDGYMSLKGGIANGRLKDDQGNVLTDDIIVQVDIINPHSVDTLAWAEARAINEGVPPGVAIGTPMAKPANFYFACADPGYPGTNYAPIFNPVSGFPTDQISAPDWQDLPVAERRCTLSNLTELMVRYNDINAMRATSPGCVKSENTRGPLLPPTDLLAPGQRQNSRYHDGAFTVRVSEVRNPGTPSEQIKPFYENYNYEHMKDLDGPPRGMDCEEVNEDLRAWRKIEDVDAPPDPCEKKSGADLVNCRNANPGSDPDNPGGALIEFGGSGGFIGFVGVPELRVDPYSGGTGGGGENCPIGDDGCNEFLNSKYQSRRVNWREIISE